MLVPKSPAQIKRLTSDKLKLEYNDLAEEYGKLVSNEVLYCSKCGSFLYPDSFYSSDEFKTGRFPICKKCLADMATDYDSRREANIDNRDKLLRVFHMLNLPYSDDVFRSYKEKTDEGSSVAQMMMSQISSWARSNNKTWADSVFDRTTVVAGQVASPSADRREVRAEIKKIFGVGFTEEDYLFLQDQYDDWRARTQVDSKSQETYVQQICLQLLDIDKDRKSGKDTTNKIKALDVLMNSANLQPKQNVANAATDSLSLGQLIEKYENDKPIPEADDEFKDINGIGKLFRVYFAGHLSKALGLKNRYSEEYDKEISKYTVEPPNAGDDVMSDTYQQLFGGDDYGNN